MTISNCRIFGNVASGNGSNGQGGGLYFGGNTLVLRNVIFSGNAASDVGKAWYSANGSVVVEENVVVEE